MTEQFVSHSINYEDVLLRRIFRDQPTGFYIDVGAAHPIDDSDTYMLHRRGWSGINIEPNPDFFRALEQERPADRNLNLALSDRDGSIVWHRVGNTGLSTCDSAQAERAGRQGYVITRHTVRTTTLACILADACPASIDLLKVDVEGLELQVLSGNNWDRWRPSLIVVEATLPESPKRRAEEVAPYLEQRGYRRMHFDGLNDWFAEASFVPPPDAFLPPNVFDGFVSRAQAEFEAHTAALEAHTADLTKQAQSSTAYALSLKAYAADLEEELERLRSALANATEDARRSRTEAAATYERHVQLAANYEKALFASECLRRETAQLRNELENETARLRNELEDETARLRNELENQTQLRNERENETARLRNELENNAARLQDELEVATRRRIEIEGSTSWRVTRPMRELVDLLRRREH
jgi:FkbM family methyltransferase